MNHILSHSAIWAVLLSLTACQVTKEQLGLTRHTPDEFAVMERAPLAIPPDLNQLPRPNLGAPRPQETPATLQAKTAVLGEQTLATTASTSAAEDSLIRKAGAPNTPAGIRALVNSEVNTTGDKRPVVKRILDLGQNDTSATVVDAKKESTRILQEKAQGKKVTGSATPTVVE